MALPLTELVDGVAYYTTAFGERYRVYDCVMDGYRAAPVAFSDARARARVFVPDGRPKFIYQCDENERLEWSVDACRRQLLDARFYRPQGPIEHPAGRPLRRDT